MASLSCMSVMNERMSSRRQRRGRGTSRGGGEATEHADWYISVQDFNPVGVACAPML